MTMAVALRDGMNDSFQAVLILWQRQLHGVANALAGSEVGHIVAEFVLEPLIRLIENL